MKANKSGMRIITKKNEVTIRCKCPDKDVNIKPGTPRKAVSDQDIARWSIKWLNGETFHKIAAGDKRMVQVVAYNVYKFRAVELERDNTRLRDEVSKLKRQLRDQRIRNQGLVASVNIPSEAA